LSYTQCLEVRWSRSTIIHTVFTGEVEQEHYHTHSVYG